MIKRGHEWSYMNSARPKTIWSRSRSKIGSNIVRFKELYICIFLDSKLYGDYCESNSDCASSKNFICDKNRCSCATTYWYSGTQCGKKMMLIFVN